ncbi:TonB-dependent receptor [Parabacteroides bouchesdurhonensis]|nr:TonB-dependent receptor [Parabacteroides bouchesdurhonensis]RHJ93530.1 SusC/RagA family TonB-linked outer membrane protein [Bacteroides sp. AM07-16]
MNKRTNYYLKKCFFKIILLFFSLILIKPMSYANENSFLRQDITLNLSRVTLKEAFRIIEKESGLTFMYDAASLNLNRIVSIKVTNQTVENVLKQLFEGTGIGFEISGNQIIVAQKKALIENQVNISTKSRKIVGIVKDQHEEPIIGANVVIKGTNKGVITDIDGRFELDVSEGDILRITYIGFVDQEISVGNKNRLEIKLKEDTQNLDEVVVVGYGTQKKKNLTSAIVHIDSKELETTTSTNLSSTLAGRLPGLTVKQQSGAPGNDGAAIIVRGYASLNDNNPLIVVDGVVRDYFPNISSDDIEDITVLKDATASAVYGVRGAAGVILITTKRGSMQKPTVTLNSSVSLSQNAEFPKFLDGPEYVYWFNKAEEMDGIPLDKRTFSQDVINRVTNGDPQGIYGNTDWFDLLFENVAPTYSNNLSVNGGNERIRYYASLGTYNQRGIIKSTTFDRYTFRMNMDAKITENFYVEMNAYGNESRTKSPALDAGQGRVNESSSLFSQALLSYPFLPEMYDGLPTATFLNAKNQCPIVSRDQSGRQKVNSTVFQGNLVLRYKLPFIKGLEAKLNMAYDRTFTLKKSSLLSTYVNEFDLQSGTYSKKAAGYASEGVASLNEWYADTERQTVQTSLDYNNTFGKHTIGALFLYEYVRDKGNGMSAGAKDFPIRDIMDLNYGETVLDDMVKGSHSFFHRAGYVMRLNYNYDNKYLLEVTGRLDGTPNFAPGRRWGIFPGVSAGWRISEEEFLKGKADFLNDLKIRGSVGQLGNDNIGAYPYLKTAQLSVNPSAFIGNELVRKLTMSGIPSDITWEKSTSYNVGLDASLFNYQLGVEIDVFYMLTKDILQSQSAVFPPSIGGYYPSAINYGVVKNRGVEVTLTHRNTVRNVSYGIRGNMSFARNKVIKTSEDPNVPEQLRKTGHSTGLKYGFICDGLFQSQEEIDASAIYEGGSREETLVGDAKMRDLNGDGRITMDQDWTIIGRSNVPELTFGLNLNAAYKGFDVNVFFQGAALCDVALCGYYSDRGFPAHTFYTRPFFAGGNAPRYLLEGAWTPDNTDAKYERLSTKSRESGSWMSSLFIRNGAYLRLKNMQIGYSLPRKVVNNLGLEKIRFYVAGSNLFTLDHLEGLDPEMPDVNQGYYPQQRIYEFGLNIIF